MKRISLFPLIAACLCCCDPADHTAENPGDIEDPEDPVVVDPTGEADPATFDDYQRVPLSSKITGVQPMTGIVLWNTSSYKKNDAIAHRIKGTPGITG